jgi:cytosine deaminase
MTGDKRFMDAAIQEALLGRSEGGIPIGSVLERGGLIIGRGRNRRVQDGDPVMHAEIACLHDAGRTRSYRDCTLYSTLMPCYLCAGAVVQFGIPRVVAGESVNFSGARGFLEEHGVEVVDLALPDCIAMMQEYIAANPKIWFEDIGDDRRC